MNFFGISNKDFLDKNKVKIITGIAGSAKSSNIHSILDSAGIQYMRTTSTHRLRADAERRFNMKCHTIAGGLFFNDDGRFFTGERSPTFSTVVIDEILQTDRRVFDWCRAYVGICNIIITTDEKQMLSVGCGDGMVDELRALPNEIDCVVVELKKSYRPVNDITERLYAAMYNSVDSEKIMW